jgi:hypothetical protein
MRWPTRLKHGALERNDTGHALHHAAGDKLAMDPDQDILDQLDRQEGPGGTTATAIIIAVALVAGAIGYFTIGLEPNSSRELATDGGGLIAIVAGAALWVSYSKFR